MVSYSRISAGMTAILPQHSVQSRCAIGLASATGSGLSVIGADSAERTRTGLCCVSTLRSLPHEPFTGKLIRNQPNSWEAHILKVGAAELPQTPFLPEQRPSPSITQRLLLILFTLALCLVLFLLLDAGYSAFMLRSRPVVNAQATCFKSDAVRHHSLQPNCQCERHWGKQSYPFVTNNLGFRDQTIRDVPISVNAPRVLFLGDSFTEGMSAWGDTYVGQLVAKFPQYDFLNGGVESYAPSNYLNVTRQLLDRGVKFDEVIVFIDLSDAQDEAAFYRDKNPMGAVDGPEQIVHNDSWYASLRAFITEHLLITNSVFDRMERLAVRHGTYQLNIGHGQLFDLPRSAWTYRAVSDSEPYEIGYAPLGLEAGLRKEETKMTELWHLLQQRGIPVSVVVYPWPAQIAHDKVDSRQVQMWRDWCNGKCQRFISVFPEFFEVKNACPPGQAGCWYMQDFIFGDEHYSPAGNELVAGAVGKSLEANPPVKRN